MISSPLGILLLECTGMLIGTFLCGVIPLYLSLSKTKLRVLEVMGAGLLVGASMTVVLPEGTQALYSAASNGLMIDHDHHSKRSSLRERKFDPESTVGIAILAGFLIMFLIDQIVSPGAHVHSTQITPDREAAANNHHWHGPSNRPESLRLTRASSLMVAKTDKKDKSNLPDIPSSDHSRTTSSSQEGSPEQMPDDHDNVPHSQAHLIDASPSSSHIPDHMFASNQNANRQRKSSDTPIRPDQQSSNIAQNRGIRQAFASIAGLIIHAAADGIAMGASAGSKDESLKLVVLLAIMIHKAPAAFGLCTLLMGQRLHKRQITRAIAIFSMSTPLGALVTYLFLSVFLSSGTTNGGDGIGQEHIGGALTFSAGTFLFVAMHAVQELTSSEADIDLDASPHHHHHHHHSNHARHAHPQDARMPSSHNSTSPSASPPRQILGRTGRVSCFLLGTILPKLLQTLVGHHH